MASSPNDCADTCSNSHIEVRRSDGLTHDIVSVFKHPQDMIGLTKNTVSTPPKDQTDNNDHSVIKLHRSDGLNCDIIKVFKGMSDARGGSMQPVKAHLMNDYFIERSSMSKIEVQNSTEAKSNYSTGFPAYSNPTISNAPTSVKIIHMSNTHNHLVRNSSTNFLPEGDILIHSGGFTVDGTLEEFSQFDAWLSSVRDIYHYRIIVAGLNDVKLSGNDWDFVRENLPNATHVLCHSEAVVLGIRIYGIPWHWAHEPNYSIKPGAPSSTSGRFNDIPDGIDVLVTHGPAFGKLDVLDSGFSPSSKESKSERLHTGSRELEDAIRHVRPGLHLHGLCAASRGMLSPHGYSPLTLNSCMCDPTARVMYTAPQVVKCNLTYTGASEKFGKGHSKEFLLDSLF